MTPRSKARAFVALTVASGIVLFVAALFFDCAKYERTTYDGALMALIGFMGPLAFHFGWYANPMLLVSWVLSLVVGRRSSAVALGLSSVAVLLGLTSFYTLANLTMLGRNEGETAGEFLGFGPGIYLWTLSMLSAPTAAWISLRASWRRQGPLSHAK